MTVLLAFLKRDYWTQTSYRFALAETVLGVAFAAGLYYFLGELISTAPELGHQGTYFGFVIVGLILTSLFDASIFQLARIFRTEQTMGTLDALLATQIGLPTVLAGSAIWTYAFVLVESILYLVLAALLGVDLGAANWLAGGLVGLLALACFASLGIVEAGIGIIIKRGNPAAWVLSSFSAFIGGAYFPQSLLPEWLQWVSVLHPLTYAARGVRHALLDGASFNDVAPDAAVLLGLDLLFVPLSMFIFARAVRAARVDGSLSHV